MLREVRIRNLAVIQEMTARFEQGLHVITGETGSGKSILLHAIGLISGARASRTMIRKGADSLYVEGIFSPPAGELLEDLSQYGVEKGEPLVLSRTVHASGKSSARIQGQLVTLAELKATGDRLIDVYGQKDRSLLEQDRQRQLLDSFFTDAQKELRDEYRSVFMERKQKQDFLLRYGTDSTVRERELDILRYQIEEIEAFDPSGTDMNQLETEHRQLLHAEELLQIAEQIHGLLDGWSDEQPGAVHLLSTAQSLAHKMEGLDSSFAISERLAEISILLTELQSDVTRAAEDWRVDPRRLEELDQRIGDWMRLQRKYGQSKEEVLAFYEKSKADYEALTSREAQLQTAEADVALLTRKMTELAERLHAAREGIGRTLDAQIVSVLAGLRMPHVEFETRLIPVSLNENGADQVVFYIRTNRGQALQPLHEIASGGELSRVMLAIRSLFSDEFASGTIVFDEIDTGVSGRAAQAMAEYLHRLSQTMQILAVTHLPQIASMGDAHSRIEKETQGEETFSTLTLLSGETRTDEVARLISGITKTESATAQAVQLLDAAGEWKQGGMHGL